MSSVYTPYSNYTKTQLSIVYKVTKEYSIELEKQEYFHNAGTFPVRQAFSSRTFSKEEAVNYIIQSDEARLETLMDQKGMKNKIERDAFKAKFYSGTDMPINHASRVILAQNKNDGRIKFPKSRPKI